MNDTPNSVRETITSIEWDSIITQRVQALGEAWTTLSEDDRFWMVFNWCKACQIFDPHKAKRQLFMSKPYWQISDRGSELSTK